MLLFFFNMDENGRKLVYSLFRPAKFHIPKENFIKFQNFGQSVSRNLTASTQILLLFLNLRLKLHVLLNFQVFSLMKHFFPKLDASLVVENRPVVTECPGVVDYSVIDQKFGISVSEYPILHVRVTFLRL